MKSVVATSNAEPGDLELVARATEGDQDAFRGLVERYEGRVFRLALRMLKDEEKARDASQDAFLKAYRNLAKFEGRSGFYTWLYRLVVNRCLDLLRRDKSSRHFEWDDERDSGDDSPLSGSVEGPAAGRERSELRKMLAEVVEALPEDARRTLLLREVDGLSYEEIAEVLGVPKGTVMSRLHYARKRARELLEQAGFRIGETNGS